MPTFSQSSFVALLAGLAVLAALRWSLRWTLAAVGAGAVGAVARRRSLAGGSGKLTSTASTSTLSGRGNLVSGGLDLFAQRPLWGYGSGSFPSAYRDIVENRDAPVSVSHTEPITVAAEQGLIGLAAYLALLVAAVATLASGLGSMPAGGAGWRRAGDRGRRRVIRPPLGAAVLAAFVALLVHTLAYAGFFEDPITWVLLAVGGSLALRAGPRRPRRRRQRVRIPAPPGDDRRRLHGGEHPLEADRGRAAAALHALPDARPTTARPRSSSRRSSPPASSSASA